MVLFYNSCLFVDVTIYYYIVNYNIYIVFMYNYIYTILQVDFILMQIVEIPQANSGDDKIGIFHVFMKMYNVTYDVLDYAK